MAVELQGEGKCTCETQAKHLTKREVDVLLLIAEEVDDLGIADMLGVSEYTVQTHTKNMRRKIGVRSRVGLITRCFTSGVLVVEGWMPRWSGSFCPACRSDLQSTG